MGLMTLPTRRLAQQGLRIDMKLSRLFRTTRIKIGSTRLVILVGSYAIKIAWGCCYEHWLRGLVANIVERKVSMYLDSPHIARCYWRSPLGIISVHERVQPARHSGLWHIDLAALVATQHRDTESWWMYDAKQNNFGYRGPTLVKLDYDSDGILACDDIPLL